MDDDRWGAYRRWNDALAEVVYGPEATGVPTYLDLEDDVLRRAAERGGEPGSGRAGLIAAVRPTLSNPASPRGVFAGHLTLLSRWCASSGDPPPVLALLGVLCLAAEDMRNGDGFAPNNYYDRLMPLLGLDGKGSKNWVITAYRQCSHELWGCLNSWLDDLQGERGLPTAYALSHEHIGRPLSQALLRATDRHKLGEFFTELGLQPRSRLLPSDMQPLLAEWVGRNPSPASNALRAMWKRAGARERITDMACEFLSSWEPSADTQQSSVVGTGPHRSGSSLRLLALLRTFPQSELELGVLGPGNIYSGTVLDLLLMGNEEGTAVPLDVEPLPGGRWRLTDPDQLDSASKLAGHLRVRDRAGHLLQRRPRRLVPMVKDDLIHSYVEAERLPLSEGALLLCREDLTAATSRALSLVARPGFKYWKEPPQGLPVGWTLFSDVQVLAALPTIDERTGRAWPEDLNLLQPLATSQVVIEGGLRLPGRVPRWSSLATPELRVTTTDAAYLEVVVRQMRALAARAEDQRRQLAGPAAVLPLSQLGLPDGDYEFRVTSAGPSDARQQTLDTARLRLRSADTPSPVQSQEPPLSYQLPGDAFAVLSASHDDTNGPISALPTSGSAKFEELRVEPSPGVPEWWGRRAGGEGQRWSMARPERLVVAGATAGDCFHTGRHHWQLPTFYGKASGGTVEGFCKHCGLVKRFPARYRISRRRAAGATARANGPEFDVSTLPRVDHRAIHPDVVLDALSHDSRGQASALEFAALQVEPSKLFADYFVRALESLAHLMVSRDRQTLASVDWEVAAPALVEITDGNFVLIGRRGRRLVDAIAVAAEHAGVQLERTEQASAPSRLRLRGCTGRLATSIVAQVSDAVDAPIRVCADAAATWAAKLPPISAVAAALPKQPMIGYRRCDRWDPDVARWAPAADASTPGAYKLIGAGTIYCIRDRADIADAQMRRGDARLVKHAAALTTNKPLLGYDSETRTLYSALGADLPGLYARVAVLCSGLLPAEDTAQRVVRYRDVPSNLAAHLAALLRS